MESSTFTTWLYVANGVGVEEKLRAIERIVGVWVLGTEGGIRTDGIRNLRRMETAIVRCGRRSAGKLKLR